LEDVEGKDHLDYLGADGRILFLKKYGRKAWTELIRLRICTSGRLL
jgi:hypothetical protein